MNLWDIANCERNIREILREAADTSVGKMWMTTYQIAIRLVAGYPQDAERLNMPVGGDGSGANSLTKYLAKELVRRFQKGDLPGVELAYLDLRNVTALQLNANGLSIQASAPVNATVAIFRLSPDSEG